MNKVFGYFFRFSESFSSPLVKRSKSCIYRLPHKLSDELRLEISNNEEPSRISLKSLELKASAGPETQYENIHKKLFLKKPTLLNFVNL